MRFQRRDKLKSRPTGSQKRQPACVKVHSTLRGGPFDKRSRGLDKSDRSPFVPPEDWHEPTEQNTADYSIVAQTPGAGYRHILTPAEIRDRLALFPAKYLEPLDVVQLSRMTKKKQSCPCYGMQWGSALYLYPLEENLIEYFPTPPKPQVVQETRVFGGRWAQLEGSAWQLTWTLRTVKDFYLHNILVHELGHLLDDRNTSYVDRERYAEWFALQHGCKAFVQKARSRRRKPARRRHHAKH